MCLCLAGLNQGLGDALITQQSHAPEPRNCLLEELELLLSLLWVKARRACEVSARPLQIRDNIVCHRIDHDGEDNRDILDRLLGGPRRHGPRYGDDVHLETDQFGKKIGKSLILPFRESWLEYDVAAFDITEVGKSLSECLEVRR